MPGLGLMRATPIPPPEMLARTPLPSRMRRSTPEPTRVRRGLMRGCRMRDAGCGDAGCRDARRRTTGRGDPWPSRPDDVDGRCADRQRGCGWGGHVRTAGDRARWIFEPASGPHRNACRIGFRQHPHAASWRDRRRRPGQWLHLNYRRPGQNDHGDDRSVRCGGGVGRDAHRHFRSRSSGHRGFRGGGQSGLGCRGWSCCSHDHGDRARRLWQRSAWSDGGA